MYIKLYNKLSFRKCYPFTCNDARFCFPFLLCTNSHCGLIVSGSAPSIFCYKNMDCLVGDITLLAVLFPFCHDYCLTKCYHVSEVTSL